MNTEPSSQFHTTLSERETVRWNCPLCNTTTEIANLSGPQEVDCDNCGMRFVADPAQFIQSTAQPLSTVCNETEDELLRWLAGAPIEKRPLSLLRRIRSWCRCHPIQLGLVTVLLLALLSGVSALALNLKWTSQALVMQKQHNQSLVLSHRRVQRKLAQDLAETEARCQQANARSQSARREAHLEVARYLSQQSQQFVTLSPQLRIELAAEALKITSRVEAPITSEAHQVLRDGLLEIDGKVLQGHSGKVTSVAFSPDCRWLASGSVDHTAVLWDLNLSDPSAAAITLRGHESRVSAVEFSLDKKWLVTGSSDSTVRRWDLQASNPAHNPAVLRGSRGRITDLAISANSRLLVTAGGSFTPSESAAYLWDLPANPPRHPVELTGHRGQIRVVAISPDNRWIVTAAEDGTARLWDPTTVRQAAMSLTLRGHRGAITSAMFSPDSRWLATSGGFSSEEFGVRLWDLSKNVPDCPISLGGHAAEVVSLAIGPKGRWLVTGSVDGTARVWDLKAQDPSAHPIALQGPSRPIQSLTIGPKANWIVSGNADGTVHLWGLNASGPSKTPVLLKGHRGPVTALATSPNGRWLVSAGEDATVRLWSLRIEELIEMAATIRQRSDTEVTRRLADRSSEQANPSEKQSSVVESKSAQIEATATENQSSSVDLNSAQIEAARTRRKKPNKTIDLENVFASEKASGLRSSGKHPDPISAMYEGWVKESEVARSKNNAQSSLR